MKYIYILICCLFVCLDAFAKFDFNNNCKEAYSLIIDLKLDNAKKILNKEREVNPENVIVEVLDNYIDYYKVFCSEKKTDLDYLIKNKSDRLDKIDNEDKNSPYFLYSKAVIHIQWGVLAIRFGEYYSAILDFKKAYSLLEENISKYPSFLPQYVYMGQIQTFMSNIPERYLNIINTLGFNINKSRGLPYMQKVVEDISINSEYSFFYKEMAITYVFLNANFNFNIENTYNQSEKILSPISDSCLLKVIILSQIGVKSGKSDNVIEMINKRVKDYDYENVYYLDYLLGVSQLNNLNPESDNTLKLFLKNYNGVFNIKDANLKLSWYYQIFNNPELAKTYRNKVSNSGFDYAEKDKQALSEVKKRIYDVNLLKARLLYDGGSYYKADSILKTVNILNLSEIDKIEFRYRQGRVYAATNKNKDAIAYYLDCIKRGKYNTAYYAGYSCFYLAEIYSKNKQQDSALFYYKKCIDLPNYEFRSSLVPKAKNEIYKLSK